MRSSASSSSRGVKYRTLSDLIRSPSDSIYCFKSDYKNIIISIGYLAIMIDLRELMEYRVDAVNSLSTVSADPALVRRNEQICGGPGVLLLSIDRYRARTDR
jgi:hypothetical protein